jgi:hypothetical protein
VQTHVCRQQPWSVLRYDQVFCWLAGELKPTDLRRYRLTEWDAEVEIVIISPGRELGHHELTAI